MPRDERRTRIRLGILVVLAALVVFVVFFIVGQARGAFTTRTEIYTDLVLTSGLRPGSPVQLAGVEIGEVSGVDYVNARYACDPLTEDVGRYGAGRTNNCDERLFCAPSGECGTLEPLAEDAHYARCVDDGDCGEREICVTTEFRRREPRALWMGPNGVCVRYSTLHRRVRVNMMLVAERLPLIRRDSRASIASNSVLGDQLINITLGIGEPVEAHERILSDPSLNEDIELYRVRLERVIENTDEALASISGLVAELGDRRTLDALRGLVANLESISLAIAERRGLIGALVGSPSYKRDFGIILRALGATTGGVDRIVGTSNRVLATADRNLEPLLEDVRVTMSTLRTLLEELRHPDNRSVVAKIIDDPDGTLVARLEAVIGQTEQITAAVDGMMESIDGEKGTVGKILADPKLAEDLSRLLHNLQNKDTLRGLLLWYLEQNDFGVKASRSPAKPRRPPRRARGRARDR